MYILGIESSCDETAVSISQDGRKILADIVLSQADMHALYGGVVPEIASRKHVEGISQVTKEALRQAGITKEELDGIAVTFAPGLIGALLVGVNFAKGMALALDKPLIPVHHIRGHIAANYIAFPELEPPFVCLVVSGGHSLIVDVKSYTEMEIIGSTRDDAAGEAFDKAARVLGLPYPGGVMIDRLAQNGDPKRYKLPRAVVDGSPYDFSFSGLKTAVINIAHTAQQKGELLDREGLAASFCSAVTDTLVPRVMEVAREKGYGKLAAAGGVAANSFLRGALERECKKSNIKLFAPPPKLCGDNGAMIACKGYYEFLHGITAGPELNAYATMGADEVYEVLDRFSTGFPRTK